MFYDIKGDNTYINIKVTTKSSKNCFAGIRNDEMLVHVTAAPENNKANSAVVDLLSKKLKIPKSQIQIVSGQKCRSKKICVQGMIAPEILKNI
jgi:uncharacterized protein (TIGR00251 family)